MQHNIITRAAIGLTIFLLAASMAFGWTSTFRERRLAMRTATAARDRAYDEARAASAYEARCTVCHDEAHEEEWMPSQTENREKALLEFLLEHAKAPDDENRDIAAYLARMGHHKSP